MAIVCIHWNYFYFSVFNHFLLTQFLWLGQDQDKPSTIETRFRPGWRSKLETILTPDQWLEPWILETRSQYSSTSEMIPTMTSMPRLLIVGPLILNLFKMRRELTKCNWQLNKDVLCKLNKLIWSRVHIACTEVLEANTNGDVLVIKYDALEENDPHKNDDALKIKIYKLVIDWKNMELDRQPLPLLGCTCNVRKNIPKSNLHF